MTKPSKEHPTWLHARAARPVVDALKALGHDTEALLKRCNIDYRVLEEADGKIAHRAMMQLWQAALEATGDDHLGVHLAEVAPLDTFGIHTYALQSSPTLREAYRRACRYQRLIHTGTELVFHEEAGEGILQHLLPGGASAPRQPAEFLVTLWVRFGRLLLDSDFTPTLICFAHAAPQDTREHARVFQTSIQFRSGRTAIHVPNPLLDRQNQKADISLARLLDDYALRLLADAPTAASFSAHVRRHLSQELNGGAPTANALAQTLHMSVRTLHRTLQQEGTTFRALLRQVRHEQATRLLTNPQISIAEVAFLLGFAELSSFYRAFTQWTGVTPATYRTAALGADLAEPS